MKEHRAWYVGRHRKRLGAGEVLGVIALFAAKALVIGAVSGLVQGVLGQDFDLREVITSIELLLRSDSGGPQADH